MKQYLATLRKGGSRPDNTALALLYHASLLFHCLGEAFLPDTKICGWHLLQLSPCLWHTLGLLPAALFSHRLPRISIRPHGLWGQSHKTAPLEPPVPSIGPLGYPHVSDLATELEVPTVSPHVQ